MLPPPMRSGELPLHLQIGLGERGARLHCRFAPPLIQFIGFIDSYRIC
jgi:hypothetical protein